MWHLRSFLMSFILLYMASQFCKTNQNIKECQGLTLPLLISYLFIAPKIGHVARARGGFCPCYCICDALINHLVYYCPFYKEKCILLQEIPMDICILSYVCYPETLIGGVGFHRIWTIFQFSKNIRWK